VNTRETRAVVKDDPFIYGIVGHLRNQISLELIEVHVERAIEAERCSN
jgi:hypothetical protein